MDFQCSSRVKKKFRQTNQCRWVLSTLRFPPQCQPWFVWYGVDFLRTGDTAETNYT